MAAHTNQIMVMNTDDELWPVIAIFTAGGIIYFGAILAGAVGRPVHKSTVGAFVGGLTVLIIAFYVVEELYEKLAG